MSGFATIYAPVSWSSAIELGNRQWRKRILPVGDIAYQGRQLHFTRGYLEGLAKAFRSRAYDQVSFQLADAANTHTNDPERHRGTITDMTVEDDGLYVTLQPTERGERILRENPYLGVSARIVEQYSRADGAFYPAAIQHVLGTLDPRIPGLGAWTPVEMANGGGIIIDLSGYHFSGEPAPASASLTGAELNQLLDAISEADAEYGDDDGTGLADAELEALMDAAEGGTGLHDALSELDAAFSARAQAEADRQDAISAAIVEDMMHPARRDEDRMARIISRAAQGVYSGQQYGFTAEARATDIMLANGGRGPCGPLDEYGRCSARYHDLECAHQAGGPPAETYATALANFATGLAIDLAPRAVWDDPDDYDQPAQFMPARTVELAHQLAHDWGLDATAPGFPGSTFTDLLRPPGAPVSIEDELLAGMGYEPPPQDRPSYPGVAQLAKDLGLR